MKTNCLILIALCILNTGCNSSLTAKESQNPPLLLVENSFEIPSSAKKLNQDGFSSYRSGNFFEALDLLTKAIKTEPKYSEAYVNRGHVYSKLNRLDEALSDYNRAIEIDNNVRAYSGRGLVYWEREEINQARADLNQAVKLAPKNPSVYVSRGNFHIGFYNLKQALADYNRAIELDPQHASAYNNRGFVYEKSQDDLDRLGSRTEALADYDRAIELDPQLATAYLNRGILSSNTISQELRDRAYHDYNRAIELNSQLAIAFNFRGIYHFGQKQYYQAINDCSRAIEIDSQLLGAYGCRGVAYKTIGDSDRGESDLEKVSQIVSKWEEEHNHDYSHLSPLLEIE